MSMNLLNEIGIDTPHGTRMVELYQGDLMRLDQPVGVLVISAVLGRYYPLPGTVIAALEQNFDLRVADLEASAELDLRPGLRTWLSRPLRDGLPYERIACVETPHREENAGALLSNAFVALNAFEAMGVEIDSVALPILGAGSQGHSAASVAKALTEAAASYLRRSLCASVVRFVEIDEIRAGVLNDALNDVLGRPREAAANSEFIEAIRDDILSLLPRLEMRGETELVKDLRRVLNDPPYHPYQLGVHGRRLVECLVRKMSSGSNRGNLARGIDSLVESKVAPWIRSYMHVLRHIGNETVHYRSHDERDETPPYVEPDDVAIALSCIQRLLQYWVARDQGEHRRMMQ